MERIIGVNPVTEALLNKEKNIEKLELYNGLKGETVQKLKELASKRNIKIFYTNKKIDNSQGVAVYISNFDYYKDFDEAYEELASKDKSVVLILDEIQDPRNFGAIIRSAEVFKVDLILIPERNSVRINETVVKTSTGAIEYVNISKVTNLSDTINKLKKLDYWVYGAAGEASINYNEEDYPNKIVLVLGNEGSGIRKKVREHCDKLIKIPMFGQINSLNVSVASGILLSRISAIRKANTQKNSILNEALTTSSMIEDSSDIDNYISSENNPEEAYLLKEEIKEFKNFSDKNFSKFEKEVLKYLIRGYSYREIAKILSKNLKSIDNTIQRIRKKSEDWINKEEI